MDEMNKSEQRNNQQNMYQGQYMIQDEKGNWIPAPGNPIQASVQEPRRKKKHPILITIVILVILMIGCSALLSDESSDNNTSPTTSVKGEEETDQKEELMKKEAPDAPVGEGETAVEAPKSIPDANDDKYVKVGDILTTHYIDSGNPAGQFTIMDIGLYTCTFGDFVDETLSSLYDAEFYNEYVRNNEFMDYTVEMLRGIYVILEIENIGAEDLKMSYDSFSLFIDDYQYQVDSHRNSDHINGYAAEYSVSVNPGRKAQNVFVIDLPKESVDADNVEIEFAGKPILIKDQGKWIWEGNELSSSEPSELDGLGAITGINFGLYGSLDGEIIARVHESADYNSTEFGIEFMDNQTDAYLFFNGDGNGRYSVVSIEPYKDWEYPADYPTNCTIEFHGDTMIVEGAFASMYDLIE